MSIIQCRLNTGSPVDIDEAYDMRGSQLNKLQCDDCIPNIAAADLEAIIAPEVETE